jgi:hypothetical protein
MKRILLMLICLMSLTALAQVTNQVEPRSWGLEIKSTPLKIIIPSINKDLSQTQEDYTNELQNKPYKFGEKIDVELDLYNSGQWVNLKNGDRIWRINIVSQGAKTMNFLFDRYDLPEGAEMFLYNNDRSDKIGPYTSKENQEDGILGTWIIYGDNIWIEYYEPARVRGFGRISIDQVVHGYRGFGKVEKDFKDLNRSGDCNVDVNCNPNAGSINEVDWKTIRDNYRQAVARIIINGNGLCTGTLINNQKNDGTPYMYTANHCLGAPDGQSFLYNASDWSFGFEWFATSTSCATNLESGATQNPTQVITGATLKMNQRNSDTALFLLNQLPPATWDLYYAGWDRSSNIPTAQLGVHHPKGDVMKIARNDQPVVATAVTIGGSTAQSYEVANWDYGVTEGGSSGSVLLNPDGRIIGELFGGSAACNEFNTTTDNNAPDFYGRFNVAWEGGGSDATRLKTWLDPDGTSNFTKDGAFFKTLSSPTVENAINIKIYPNPSRGMFTIESDLPTTFQVYNLNGQVILTGSTGVGGDQLNLTGVAEGLYFVKIAIGEETITLKLIKQ